MNEYLYEIKEEAIKQQERNKQQAEELYQFQLVEDLKTRFLTHRRIYSLKKMNPSKTIFLYGYKSIGEKKFLDDFERTYRNEFLWVKTMLDENAYDNYEEMEEDFIKTFAFGNYEIYLKQHLQDGLEGNFVGDSTKPVANYDLGYNPYQE